MIIISNNPVVQIVQPQPTNPQVIDMLPGEYLSDVLARILDASEEKPYTINFFNYSKTIDWTRFTAKIQWPRWVYLNFVGDINWWSTRYYLGMVFDENLLVDNPIDKLFLGFSFSRFNQTDTFYKSGLPLNLDTIYFGGLDNNGQEADEYQDLINNPNEWGDSEFNLVRVNGNKIDNIKNDALYKKINNIFIDVTPDFRLCNMSCVSAKGACFYSANIQRGYFECAIIDCAIFERANLEYANFANSNCKSTSFTNSNCKYTAFDGANLYNAFLNNTDCQGAYFGNSNCQNTNFVYANLKQTNWDNVISIINSNFQNANLTGAVALPTRINTKAKFIAECGASNVNAQTIWIDGTSILS